MVKRKPKLEPGYRWLLAGEILVTGDEYRDDTTGLWKKTSHQATSVCSHEQRCYRRKVHLAEPQDRKSVV